MSRKNGFTIVELMVASTILVLLLGAFLGAFQNILTTAKYSEGLSFAYTACLNQLEGIINQDFSTIKAQGENWTFAPLGFPAGFQASGNVTVADQPELYGGGEWSVTPSANWSVRFSHTSLVYDNRMWVMGGVAQDGITCLNDVWNSTDGINWTNVTWTADWSKRFFHTSLVYKNRMWVMGGYDGTATLNDVWYSNDGRKWTRATNNAWSLGKEQHTSLVYKDRMWVIGGGRSGSTRSNEVWASVDGVTWTLVTVFPPGMVARSRHASLVYDNRMWVMGGEFLVGPGTDYILNDVWYSTNGATWTEETTSSPMWSIRSTHNISLVYDNKMWIMGGYRWSCQNDIWYSSDGINWAQATAHANWSVRSSFAPLVYDGKMWVLGGFNKDEVALNDVWNSAGYDRLLEVVITVCWRQPDSRLFGEDANLDGNWTIAEDTNDNGQFDSPAQLRVLLSEKNILNLRKTFLGRQ